MNSISVIIAIKGMPAHIEETLESIKSLANEIIIADIGIDSSLKNKLSQNPHIKFHTIHKPVPYIELIREELKHLATNEYVLFLDPDEVLTDELKKTILKVIPEYDYISIPRKNIIFDKWIEHSRWWPDYQIRAFKKSSVSWPTIIHAQPKVQGKEYKIEPRESLAIIHYNYDSIDEFMLKLTRYTKAEARQRIQENKNYDLREAIENALSEFIGRYFAAQGYKDGIHGFVLSIMQMFYYFLVYFYYWEEKKNTHSSSEEISIHVRKFFLQGLLETNYWLIKENITNKISDTKLKIQNIFLRKTS